MPTGTTGKPRWMAAGRLPAEDAALTTRMVNKNTDPLTVLAQWQIALPQG